MTMTEVLQVVTTTATREQADALAAGIVGRRLAGCVQVVGPITSTYHWQGKLEHSTEWLCIAKTMRSHYPALEAALREIHTYEVPEILAFEAVAGHGDYLTWLSGELADLSSGRIV
jgi:periplasmic divalent cation tolerance protein